jgi:hypothetical protein
MLRMASDGHANQHADDDPQRSASGACRNSRGCPRPDTTVPEAVPGRTGIQLPARAELPRIDAAVGEARVISARLRRSMRSRVKPAALVYRQTDTAMK